MKRRYSPEFIRALKKSDVRIRKSFRERIVIFAKNPNDPKINNHTLKREWAGYRSIDITNDYRAVYREKSLGGDMVAHFMALGPHDELYKKKS